MTEVEFRHNIQIPLKQIEKTILYRLEGYKEQDQMKRLFVMLDKALSKIYEEIGGK